MPNGSNWMGLLNGQWMDRIYWRRTSRERFLIGWLATVALLRSIQYR